MELIKLRSTIATAALALAAFALSPAAFAQESALTQNFEAHKAATAALMSLFAKPVTDAASAEALEKQIAAETNKRRVAEEGIQNAMQKMDEKNPQHVKAVENVFAEIQQSNEKLAAAQLKANEAIAKAKQPVQPPKK